jgi:hypothetical protein
MAGVDEIAQQEIERIKEVSWADGLLLCEGRGVDQLLPWAADRGPLRFATCIHITSIHCLLAFVILACVVKSLVVSTILLAGFAIRLGPLLEWCRYKPNTPSSVCCHRTLCVRRMRICEGAVGLLRRIATIRRRERRMR